MRKSWDVKVDTGQTMREMWEGFAQKVMPDVPEGSPQYDDMMAAFHAGGLCLFHFLMIQLDPGDEPTENDLSRVSRIEQELQNFFRLATPLRSATVN